MDAESLSTPLQPPTFSSPLTPRQSSEPQIPELNAFHATPSSLSAMEVSHEYAISSVPLENYSIPTPPMPLSHNRNHEHELMGDYIFGSDLSQDDMAGFYSSAPYVSFSASMIPSQRKIANVSSLGFGAILSPFSPPPSLPSPPPPPPVLRRNSTRCEHCGAYVNLYCPITSRSGTWRCVFCEKDNYSGGEFMLEPGEDLSAWNELSVRVADYVQPAVNSDRRFSSASDSALSAPVIFVIDETLDSPLLTHLQASLMDVIDKLSPTTRISIITFGQSVSIYDLSQSEVASADVFTGESSLSSSSKSQMIHSNAVYVSSLHACIHTVKTIISSFRPYSPLKPEMRRHRCIHVAIQSALTLLQGPATSLPKKAMKRTGGSSKVVVCTAGMISYGIGSVTLSRTHPDHSYEVKSGMEYANRLGHEANQLDCAIDILCAGNCPLQASVLSQYSRSSGGIMLLHEDFGSLFKTNLLNRFGRNLGSRGIIEVRVSSQVDMYEAVGLVETIPNDASVDQNYAMDPLIRLNLLSVDEGNGICFYFKLKKDVLQPFVYFQFSVQFTDVNQLDVRRIITVRLPSTDDINQYLKCMDEDAVSVLMAKKAVMEAEEENEAMEMIEKIDSKMYEIASKFGKYVKEKRMYEFPKELGRIPLSMFHLKRGMLLGNIVNSEDERIILRDLFLRSNFLQSLSILIPCVYFLDRKTFEFSKMSAYDTVLQTDAAFLLDHGTDLFVWFGHTIWSDEQKLMFTRAKCLGLVEKLSEFRFPSPKVLFIQEGSSSERYVLARLLPSQHQSIKGRRVLTDEVSLSQWMNDLKISMPCSI